MEKDFKIWKEKCNDITYYVDETKKVNKKGRLI